MSRSPRLSVAIEKAILLDTDLEEATQSLRHTRFELEVADVLVLGQTEVLSRLRLRNILATNRLRDLLLLLDNVNDVAEPVRVTAPMCATGVEEDVVDGADALYGTGDSSALGLLQSTDTGLALDCGGGQI